MFLALVLAPLAHAQDCATPAVLDALRGRGPAPHAAALQAPERLGLDLPPPPGGGRSIYGTPYENHLETEHFTINWWTPGLDSSAAATAGEALEQAWTALVEEQGWIPPVSSDRYYLWVLLDPGLGGTTGYTTEYTTELYPQGYPVIYLNPSWASEEAFWASLAAHEFMHALQYALREWDGTDEGESWYWEASATWASELADPEVDGHQYTSAWYATQPELRFDSTTGSHQYGIFVFNAWLEEHRTGAGGMKAAWELSADRPGTPWDLVLEESTGAAPGELWAGFTGAYGNDGLAESDLYTEVTTRGTLADGASGSLPYLGTHYWEVEADASVEADGEVVLAGASATGGSIEVEAGEVLAVTGLADDVDYVLLVEVLADEDGGADDDPPDGGSDNAGGGGLVDAGDKGGCSSVPAPASVMPALAALWGLRRRRR